MQATLSTENRKRVEEELATLERVLHGAERTRSTLAVRCEHGKISRWELDDFTGLFTAAGHYRMHLQEMLDPDRFKD
jgi:hypothetical protein